MISTETSDDHNQQQKIYITKSHKKSRYENSQKIQDSQHNFKTAFFGGNST